MPDSLEYAEERLTDQKKRLLSFGTPGRQMDNYITNKAIQRMLDLSRSMKRSQAVCIVQIAISFPCVLVTVICVYLCTVLTNPPQKYRHKTNPVPVLN
jgi:hypothetical protein